MTVLKSIDALMEQIGDSEEAEFSISSQIRQLAEEFRSAKLEYGTRLLQIELDCVNFQIRRDGLHYKCLFKDRKGNDIVSPDIRSFKVVHARYLERRIKHVTSSLLLLRYNLVLLTVTKHNQWAKGSIEQILEITKRDLERPAEERYRHNFRMSNLLPLAMELSLRRISEQTPCVISHYWQVVDSLKTGPDGRLRDLFDLLDYLVAVVKELQTEDVERLALECESLHSIAEKSHHPTWVESAIKLVIRYHEQVGNDSKSWKLRLAVFFEKMMDSRGPKPSLYSYDYCLKAVQVYLDIQDHKNVERLTLKFEDIKNGMRLEGLPISIKSPKETLSEIDSIVSFVCELDEHDAIGFLASDSRMIPSRKGIEQDLQDSSKDAPLSSFAGRFVLDQSKNLSKKTEWGSASHEAAQIIEVCDFYMTIYHIPLTHLLIVNLFQKGKLSYHNMISFLQKCCWYAQPDSIALLPNSIREFDWFSQIKSIIADYFSNLAIAQEIHDFSPNFMLSIDSISTKIEGLLRSFCQLQHIPTTKFRRVDDVLITEHKNLNDLLWDSKLEKVFGEDNTLFFRWVLIEKGGWNLRNAVCHGFMRQADYSIVRMHLLFLILLRLSTYELRAAGEPPEA